MTWAWCDNGELSAKPWLRADGATRCQERRTAEAPLRDVCGQRGSETHLAWRELGQASELMPRAWRLLADTSNRGIATHAAEAVQQRLSGHEQAAFS